MAIGYTDLMIVPWQIQDTFQHLMQHNAKYGVDVSTSSAQNKTWTVPANKVWFVLTLSAQNNYRATYHKITIGHSYVSGKTGYFRLLSPKTEVGIVCSMDIMTLVDQLNTITLTDYLFETGDSLYRVFCFIELDRSYIMGTP